MSSNLFQAFHTVYNAESGRLAMSLQNMRLYGNHSHLEFTPGPSSFAHGEKLTYNLCRVVTDTIVSQVARHRVTARFLTSGGDWRLQQRAKRIGRFVDSEMDRLGMRLKAPRHALDATVWGTGFLHPYIKHGRICLDRVLESELFVDPAEAYSGEPRSLYRRRWVNRDTLIARFPKLKGQILASTNPADQYSTGMDFASSGPHREALVEVVESWHLRSGPKEKDGKHVIAIDKAVLACEDWEFDDFPFVRLCYGDRLTGWWGVGAVENLTPIQIELNRTLMKLQKIYHLVAVPRVFVNAGAGLKKNQINNDIGAVYTYKGDVPIFAPPTQAGGEIFNYVQTLIERGHSQEGVSQFIAAGQKPAGLTAGVAIREANELQMGKLAMFMNSWDEAHTQLAKWLVRLGKVLSKQPGGFQFMAKKDRYSVDKLDWKDVDMEEDQYVIQVFPTSALPNEPSGRLATVADMMQMGMASPKTAKRLVNFPDLEEEESLDAAEEDAINRQLELIIHDGAAVVPEPFQSPVLALKKAQAEYNRSFVRGVPEERLNLLRTYMSACEKAIEAEQVAHAQVHAANANPGAGSPPPTGFAGQPPTAAPGPGEMGV